MVSIKSSAAFSVRTQSALNLSKSSQVYPQQFSKVDEVRFGSEVGLSPQEAQLIDAAQQHRLEEVKKLLTETDVNINVKDDFGRTPLMDLAGCGNKELIQLLLDKGADPYVKDNIGDTVLMTAVGNTFTNLDVVNLFLNLPGMDIHAKNRQGENALFDAAILGHKDIAEALINKGLEVNYKNYIDYSPVMIAAEYGHDSVVKLLLDHGADLNDSIDNGHNLLMLSAYHGKKAMVDLLLGKGLEINALDCHGGTALSAAVHWDNTEMVKTLLNRQADTTIRDDLGFTPLMYAMAYRRGKEMQQALKGANQEPLTLKDRAKVIKLQAKRFVNKIPFIYIR
jgi:ankyrin repeat protein